MRTGAAAPVRALLVGVAVARARLQVHDVGNDAQGRSHQLHVALAVGQHVRLGRLICSRQAAHRTQVSLPASLQKGCDDHKACSRSMSVAMKDQSMLPSPGKAASGWAFQTIVFRALSAQACSLKALGGPAVVGGVKGARWCAPTCWKKWPVESGSSSTCSSECAATMFAPMLRR